MDEIESFSVGQEADDLEQEDLFLLVPVTCKTCGCNKQEIVGMLPHLKKLLLKCNHCGQAVFFILQPANETQTITPRERSYIN